MSMLAAIQSTRIFTEFRLSPQLHSVGTTNLLPSAAAPISSRLHRHARWPSSWHNRPGVEFLGHHPGAIPSASAASDFSRIRREPSFDAQPRPKSRRPSQRATGRLACSLPARRVHGAGDVAMPLDSPARKPAQGGGEAARRLDEVGLADRGHDRSGELSGGQQQGAPPGWANDCSPNAAGGRADPGDLDQRHDGAVGLRVDPATARCLPARIDSGDGSWFFLHCVAHTPWSVSNGERGVTGVFIGFLGFILLASPAI